MKQYNLHNLSFIFLIFFNIIFQDQSKTNNNKKLAKKKSKKNYKIE